MFLTFVIPQDRERVLTVSFIISGLFSFPLVLFFWLTSLLLPKQNLFEELQNRETEFGISDIQLSLTSLEEVFLNIAKQAEQESAAVEGTLETLTNIWRIC